MRRERALADAGFARGHSVARVLGVAIPLCMFLAWWGIWGGHAEVRSVSETSAIVLKCEGRTCRVRVASGEEVHVLKARNLAEGMTVRMTRTEYEDGELRFELITAGRSAPP